MTTTDDNDPVQDRIERYAVEHENAIATWQTVNSLDNSLTIYARRSPNSNRLTISFFDDVDSDAKLAANVLDASIEYRIANAVTPAMTRIIGGNVERTRAAKKIMENDAKAIHDALLDALPVQTYALLRELFATIGGRTVTDDGKVN